MALVSALCTNCGAELTVDDTKDALVCQSCGSAFIVEKAIAAFYRKKQAGECENKDFVIRSGVLEKYAGDSDDVVIPDTVVRIGSGAFEKRLNLKSVLIPPSVKEIGNGAFAYCQSLKSVKCGSGYDKDGSVVFSEKLEYIGGSAFRDCISLPPDILFLNKRRIYHDGEPVFKYCYGEDVKITVTQKGHEKPHLYSRLGSFDTELDPLVNYLFEFNFDKSRAEFKDGRSDEEIELENSIKERHSHSSHRSGHSHTSRTELWRSKGLCSHCGGEFTLLKKCRSCGRKKDY